MRPWSRVTAEGELQPDLQPDELELDAGDQADSTQNRRH